MKLLECGIHGSLVQVSEGLESAQPPSHRGRPVLCILFLFAGSKCIGDKVRAWMN